MSDSYYHFTWGLFEAAWGDYHGLLVNVEPRDQDVVTCQPREAGHITRVNTNIIGGHEAFWQRHIPPLQIRKLDNAEGDNIRSEVQIRIKVSAVVVILLIVSIIRVVIAKVSYTWMVQGQPEWAVRLKNCVWNQKSVPSCFSMFSLFSLPR